jgi:methylmalonyl-CoA mutase N-terminal domain/subunit
MDETLALPTEKAAEIALRTQQLIAYETGAAHVVDPLGGSWYIEELTDRIEAKAEEYFSEIESLGGVISAIEQGFFQREIARSASEYQSKVDEKRRIVVGVNKFIKDHEEIEIPVLEIDTETGADQCKKLGELKQSRNESNVQTALLNIQEACKNDTNLMPPIIEAAKAHVTLGEIVVAMKAEFGEWQETAVF